MNKSIEMALKRERRNRSFILKAVNIPDKPSENAPVIKEKPDESVRVEPVQVEPEITATPDESDESVQDEAPKKAKRRKRTTKNKANDDSEV